MNILHKAITTFFLCLSLSSYSIAIASTIEYPIHTFHSILSEPEDSRKVAQEIQQGEARRRKIFEELKVHNSTVTGAVKLKLKYEIRRKISDFKDVKIQTRNDLISRDNRSPLTASKTESFTLEAADIRRFDSLLLYYTKNSNSACRPKLKAVFEGEAISKQLPREVETDLGLYSSVSTFELNTTVANEKNITYFKQKYLTSTVGTEWWKTEKQDVTVYQKMMRVPLYGKSNISILSNGEVQQINVVASIRGKGDKLLEYPIIKKEVLDGNSIISLDLHSKLVAFDQSLDDLGYVERNNDIITTEGGSKHTRETANSKVIIKEIIINLLPTVNVRQSAIFNIETQGRVASDPGKKSVSVVSSKFDEDSNSYNILEIPLEKLRKYAGLRTGLAHFEGSLPTLENESCEFSPLKLVFVDFQNYKYPLAATNEWSEGLQRTLPDINQYSKVQVSATNIAPYKLVAITRPQPWLNFVEDSSNKVDIDLLNGSLRIFGSDIKTEIDKEGAVLSATARDIKKVSIRANVPKSVGGDLLINVRSLGLCGSSRYSVRLYSRGKLANETYGYANRILQVQGTEAKITEYEITFVPKNSADICTTFKFYSTAVSQLPPNFNLSYQTKDYISTLTREAIVSSPVASLSSHGLLNTNEHYYQIINNKNNLSLDLSVNLSPHLFYFDELSLISRDFSGISGFCFNTQLRLQFEHGSIFLSPHISVSDPSGCRYRINTASETDNKMGKLLRVQIKVPSVEWNRIRYFRAEVKGLYETSIIDKLLGMEYGALNTYKVNLPLSESSVDLKFDTKINPFILMITLPSNVIKTLMQPGNFFLPSYNHYFSVYEVVAIVGDEAITTTLQAWLDDVHLKKSLPNNLIIIIAFVVLCCAPYLLGNKFRNYFRLPIQYSRLNTYLAYLEGVQSSTWLLFLYCLVSVFFILISFIFPAKDVALSLTTSYLMMYSLYRFMNETQTDQFLSSTRVIKSAPLYGFIAVVLFQLTAYFFVGSILAIDLNFQCISLAIYTFVSCIACAWYCTSAKISFKIVNRYVSFSIIGILILVGWAITSRVGDNQLFLSIVFSVGVMLGSFLRLQLSVAVIFSLVCISWIVSTLFFNLKLGGPNDILSLIIFGWMASLVIPYKKGSSVKTRSIL
jgi:hypothetical protein